MTRDEAARVLISRVLLREGGVADVGDGAGVTRFGQTPAWLSTFGFEPPATVQEAAANYATWLVRTRLIELCDYPDDFADSVIDFAVNSGHRVAIKELQRLFRVSVDGVIGPETQAAIERCDRPRSARHMIAARLRFYGQIIRRNPDEHAVFAAGWMNRVAKQIEVLV